MRENDVDGQDRSESYQFRSLTYKQPLAKELPPSGRRKERKKERRKKEKSTKIAAKASPTADHIVRILDVECRTSGERGCGPTS